MITILNSNSKSRKWIGLLALSGALVLGACGDEDEASDRLTVVATTSIWGDVVSEMAGDDADVEVLIPKGADAHDYQATPQQAARLIEADLVVANGLGLEEGLHDILESAESDGANIVEIAPELEPIPFAGPNGHELEGEEPDEHESLDPHVWFDPQRVAFATDLIAAELTVVDDSVDWAARARDYVAELERADNEVSSLLASVPTTKRTLVTNHDSLGYLADRYGFEVIGVIIPGGSTLGDPSSAELADLVHAIEDANVRAIFTESTQPSALAEAVAAEVGSDMAIVELYSGSLGDPPADSLIGMLVENARRIADALG